MSRTWNFFAGPATLPPPALERAKAEIPDWEGTGMSVMETSHRSPEYDAVHQEAIALMTELLGLDDDHQVLFIQGGASMQFAMLPMNFHITSNNTIKGTQYHSFPATNGVPLVADMSSDILWRPFDANRFHLVYAGAQKNIGPSGVTIVILKKSWLEKANENLPSMLSYGTYSAKNSLYNTPPTFAIYMVRNVLVWLKQQGGLAGIEKVNRNKGDLLYGVIKENPEFYSCPVAEDSRSYMNVVFRLPTEDLEAKFVDEGKAAGMVGLKGHRSVGGCRASIYNAMPLEGVEVLADFMTEFARNNG
ncbi:MAG: 3-phosphoserine/phosphohydroxythreonine transaminase [Acidobacteriota bacterium]